MKTTKLVTLAASGALVLTPLGLVSAPAHAAGDGDFYVQVVSWGTGEYLPGIQVTLYDTATGGAVATRTTSTDDPGTGWNEAGQAVFSGLANGSYTAKAVDPTRKHAEKYSTVDSISEDDTFADGYIAMVPTTIEVGILSGTVTEAAGDVELNALVEVFPASATQASIESGQTRPVAQTRVSDYDYYGDDSLSADWSVQVPGGLAYKVRVSDRDSSYDCDYVDDGGYVEVCGYEASLWVGPAGATATTATSFSVAKAKRVSAGTTQQPSQDERNEEDRFTGTVTGPGGVTLDDVEVELFKEVTDGGRTAWLEVASTVTGADGRFGFDEGRTFEWYDYGYGDGYWDSTGWAPLTAGKYTLRYTDYAGEYRRQFLGGIDSSDDYYSTVPDGVATIQLGTADVKSASFAMTRQAVSNTSGAFGTLTDDAGRAHRGWVTFYDTFGNEITTVRTRRDGGWSAPATELPPGQYKVRIDPDSSDAIAGWHGGRNFHVAAVVTVPVKGATNIGGSKLARPATLAGTISMPTITGTDQQSRWVTLRTANGALAAETDTATNGSFSLSVAPGTYYLSADGSAYSSFDLSSVGVSQKEFVEQFWKGQYTLAGATPIKVGSGGRVTGLNMTLGHTLAATAAPKVTGTAKVGSVLRVSTGSWNVADDIAFSIVWKRGGTTVSTSSAYKLVKADAGKTLTVSVVAKDTTATYASGAANAAPVKVAKIKKKPKKKPKKGKKATRS